EPGKAFIFGSADADVEDRPSSGLTGRDLLRLLATIPGRACVVIDAPHAGGLVDDLRSVRMPPGRVPVILAACGKGESAYSREVKEAKLEEKLERGLFTEGLLRAIAGKNPRADRNQDGVLDAQEAFVAAAGEVAVQVRRLRGLDGERLAQ